MRLILLFIIAPIAFSCKPKKVEKHIPTPEKRLKIAVQPYFGSTKLNLDQSYTFDNGIKIQFSDIKFYFSELKNGSNTLADVAFFNYRKTNTNFLDVVGDYTNFGALQGYIGVHNDNHKDPAAFDNSSPLNIMNSDGMHWGWSSGFIFIQIEAKTDTLVDNNDLFDHSLIYHAGTTPYLRNFTYSDLTWQAEGENNHNIVLSLDLKAFFENVDHPLNLKKESITHSGSGQEQITLKVVQNFNAALKPL